MEGSRMMNASLVLLKKDGAYKAFPLAGTVTVLGRRHDCDLRISLPEVSRRHCQVSQNGDSLALQDLGSRWGTFLNNKRVDKDKTVAVRAGDYLRIGPLIFVCQINGKPEKITPPRKGGTPAPEAKPQPQEAVLDVDDDELSDKLDEDLSDLDVSGSFADLDESDSDLEDLKNA
jgi:pSer/pThr/pTyr-binding forkhead associated (FHA) protein